MSGRMFFLILVSFLSKALCVAGFPVLFMYFSRRFSPWARTLETAIWYQNEGQILTLIFNNIDSSRLFWCTITMPNE